MLLSKASLDVATAAATKTLRPVLSALNITRSHCVATDSYHLIEVEHPKQEGRQVPPKIPNDQKTGLVPAEAALHASKNIPKVKNLFDLSNAFSSVDSDGKRMMLATTDLQKEKTVDAIMIDGKFPDYQIIFPDKEPVASVTVDAQYLKAIADYFSKHADAKRVTLHFHGKEQPLVFTGKTAKTIQKVRALVMPLRNVDDDDLCLTEDDAKAIEQGLQQSMPDLDVSVSLNGQ